MMDLKKIIAVAGKSGLFEILGQSKTAFIVKSLVDGRKIPIFISNRVSTLDEIIVFTESGEMKLIDVFKKIYDKTGGEEAINHKVAEKDLIAYFEEAVPNYDKKRVYVSDIRKIIFWYNLLHKNNLLDFSSLEKKEEEVEEKESKEVEIQKNKE